MGAICRKGWYSGTHGGQRYARLCFLRLRTRQAAAPLRTGGGTLLWLPPKGGMAVGNMTWADFFAFCMVVLTLVGLILEFHEKKK